MAGNIFSELLSLVVNRRSESAASELFDLESVAQRSRAVELNDWRGRPRPPEEVSEEEQRPRREIVARPNATVQVRARARRAAIAADLRSSEGARRAFILQQILGRPRSRSEWDEN